MKKIILEIKDCRGCPYHTTTPYPTADSFERAENWLCSHPSVKHKKDSHNFLHYKLVAGYETLKGASKNTFNPNKLKHAYNIRLSENEQDWVHIYKTKGEYIAKAYVSNTPESMESFMREFFRKGAGCNSLPKIGE